MLLKHIWKINPLEMKQCIVRLSITCFTEHTMCCSTSLLTHTSISWIKFQLPRRFWLLVRQKCQAQGTCQPQVTAKDVQKSRARCKCGYHLTPDSLCAVTSLKRRILDHLWFLQNILFVCFKQNQACIQHVFRHNTVEKVQRDKHMNGAWVAILRLPKKGNFTHLRRKKCGSQRGCLQ